MTELEMHLLNALEQLQQDYTQRLKDWESAFTDLQHMFIDRNLNPKKIKKTPKNGCLFNTACVP
ncbi:MbeD family mobilization/exclusion protein [Escherichia coli]|nr:MbeD family mobilization/exclusion protein [Escherichia coli]EEY0664942.1 MbeD family mobilization/exclusion protein [Escherichia coli]EEY1422701.1 MbeD family mobilization/exclusion protein [Escherichia coli]EFF6154473.1 MbeD family mobilization/exclusion protein [Escherichia coli]EFI1118382.1 MbeD family mobilization/exclusion protein [Escherichia coli]